GRRKEEVLEDALGDGLPREGQQGPAAMSVDDAHLPRRDVADEAGADEVEGAGLRRDAPRPLDLTERQRAEAPRVADRHDAVAGQEDERVRTLDLLERVGDRILEIGIR